MNPIDPLSPEAADELLSAELDGAFDATARDLGYEPEVARELLDATPGIDARRDAFAAARDALVVPPLDPERRAAMVAAASAASFRPARARRTGRALATAAVIVLVVGVGTTLAVRSSDRGRNADTARSETAADAGVSAPSAPPTEAAPTAPSTAAEEGGASADSPTTLLQGADTNSDVDQFLGELRLPAVDFGAIDDTDALRRRVEREISAASTRADALATPVPFDAQLAPCVAQQATRLGNTPDLVAYGPARYRGEPAEVLVFRRGADHVVVVVADPRDRCRLLESEVVRSER